MFDKLEDLLIRYEEIMNELNEPDVTDDQNRFPQADEGAERSALPLWRPTRNIRSAKQDDGGQPGHAGGRER